MSYRPHDLLRSHCRSPGYRLIDRRHPVEQVRQENPGHTPNERSLHAAPTPRVGGVGLMLGVLSGWTLLSGAVTWWLLLPLILLFTVSLLDDMHNLPVTQRLLAQLAAAAILVAGVCA